MSTLSLWHRLPSELRQYTLGLYLHDVVRPEQLWKEQDLKGKEDLIQNIAAFGVYHAYDDLEEALERWQRETRHIARPAEGSDWLAQQQAKWRKTFADDVIASMKRMTDG